MIKIIQKQELVDYAESITCDKCKREWSCKKEHNYDPMEIQEFTHLAFTGGFASVFGDMNTVNVDICQHCLKELIGDFCRYNEDEEDEFDEPEEIDPQSDDKEVGPY